MPQLYIRLDQMIHIYIQRVVHVLKTIATFVRVPRLLHIPPRLMHHQHIMDRAGHCPRCCCICRSRQPRRRHHLQLHRQRHLEELQQQLPVQHHRACLAVILDSRAAQHRSTDRGLAQLHREFLQAQATPAVQALHAPPFSKPHHHHHDHRRSPIAPPSSFGVGCRYTSPRRGPPSALYRAPLYRVWGAGGGAANGGPWRDGPQGTAAALLMPPLSPGGTTSRAYTWPPSSRFPARARGH